MLQSGGFAPARGVASAPALRHVVARRYYVVLAAALLALSMDVVVGQSRVEIGFSAGVVVAGSGSDGPTSVFAADLDGDGDMDVLSASSNDNKIAWYENDGTGGFGAQQVITTLAVGAYSVFAADLDGDGDMDVLSASSNDNKIAWYENDGAGSFGAQQIITTLAVGALSVFAADLDGDGDMDVLSASPGDNKIAWYENDGTGGFGAQQIITTLATLAWSVFAADLDGDGDMDVLSASIGDDKIAWYENDGAGGFGEQQNITTFAQGARSVFAADLDGDGDMDVLSASDLGGKIAWYENDGAGGFGAQQDITTLAVGALSVFAADLDGDGDMDVLSASEVDDKIAWYENNGTGGFGAQRVITTHAEQPQSVFAADLDGDGHIDVLSASSGDDKIAWYENDGAGVFSAQQVQRIITTLADGAHSVFAADLDGDGDMDVLSASFTGDDIAWYENDGAGSFGAQQIISNFTDGANTVFAADLDNDGDMDVLSVSSGDDKIAWYENNGAGGFGAQQIITTSAPPGSATVFTADLDNDGDMDVISSSGNTISWYENDGAGVFGAQQNITTLTNTARSVFAADLDGDGDMDVLSGDSKIAWYENLDGAGGFGAQQVITTLAALAWSVFAADLDGDGDMDVLSASVTDNKIAWYENDGAGGFGEQQVITTLAAFARSVFAADLDGDGDMDVLSASSNDKKIAWYENDGAGGFGAQQVITTLADGAYSVFAADLDGDGDMDVLSASFIDDKIAWYENKGHGSVALLFGGAQVSVSSSLPGVRSVVAADFDGDGDLDVLYGSTFSGSQVSGWLENTGKLRFSARQPVPSGTPPLRNPVHDVFAADLDGDGDLDAVFATVGSVVWSENIGGMGGFGEQRAVHSSPASTFTAVFASDLDSDGDLDVVAASVSSSGRVLVTTYENNGTGNFLSPTVVLDVSASTSAVPSLVVAPLNGDAAVDIVVGYDTTVRWFVNDGSGSFSAGGPDIATGGAVDGVRCVQAVDLDNDGDMDVLSASYNDDKIAWYENDGEGGFGAQQNITALADGAYSVFAADLDGDGDMDVLSASYNDDKIAWYENDGAGFRFGAELVITTSSVNAETVFVADFDGDGAADVLFASAMNGGEITLKRALFTGIVLSSDAEGAYSVFAADVDGDGDMDVLSASGIDDTIAWYENDGAGGFGAQQVITTLAGNASFVFAADLDGDGDMDVLSASQLDDKIAWYENDGAGSFGEQQVITTLADNARSAFAADLDGDGDMDVLSASEYDNKIAWYENDGTGGFGEQQVITTVAQGANSVFAADLDGDGDMDVLSASPGDNKIAWYKNDGAGSFGAQQVITTLADGAYSVFAADLDGDGDMDVLSASYNDDKIAWYKNDGAGGFGAQQVITALADGAWSVFAADLDGDGDMDVLSASNGDDKIAWFDVRATATVAALSAVVAPASSGGNDTTCRVDILAGKPCATVEAALARLAAAVPSRAIMRATSRVALLVLGPGRVASGSGPVAFAAGGLERLTVQVDEAGAEVACPGALLDASCVTFARGAALIGGMLTVSGGRSSGDGGCVTVRGDSSSGFSTVSFRVPLFDTEAARSLDAYVWRSGGLFQYRPSLPPLSARPAGVFPASVVSRRPAEAWLVVRGCRSERRGGGLVVDGGAVGDEAAGAAVELGRLTVEDCSSAADGGGVAVLWAYGGTVVARPLRVHNCSAAGLGGGLYVGPSVPQSVRAADVANVTLTLNEAADCGPDLALEGPAAGESDAGTELANLRLVVAADSAGRPVCVSRGAHAVLPDCEGDDATSPQLAVESRRGAAVIVPPSCPPASAACHGGDVMWPNGTRICSVCGRGSSSVREGSDICEPCAAGRFAAADGQTACDECAPGRSTAGGVGAVSCTECPRGEYANATGTASCAACPPGRFQNESEQAGCVDCPPGRSNDVERAVECSQCGVGRYTDPDTLECTPCAAGRFGTEVEASSCQPCAVGSSAGSTGAVECTPCPPGQFANDTGQAACVPCFEGRYQPEANSTVCRECEAGSFNDGRGAVQCVQCPPGRASASGGLSACAKCARQTFASTEGLSACVPCDASEFRFANRTGAQLCDLCDRGEYLSFADRSDIATFRGCLPCPAGASCASGQPLALTSAWVSPLDAATGEYRALDCLPGRCLSARECGSSGGGAAAGDASCCAAGRRLPAAENPMCGACETGKEEWGGECVSCTGANGGLVLGYLVLGVALLLVLQQVTAGTSGAALSKVAIGFAQAAFAFFADDGDDSPVGGGAALSFDPLGLESSCVAPMSDLTRAVLPLVQLLLVCVLFVAIGALNAAWWSARGRRANFRTSPFTRVSVALAVFGYFPVFRVAVNLLRCEELPGGARVLRQFPTVSCSSGGYHAWVAVSWMLACALLVGLSSLILAYGRPRYMEYWRKDGEGAPARVRKIVEKRIGFLHLSYRGDSALAASWEVAVLARSSAFVAAAALGGSGDSRFALLTLVSFAALAAHVYVQPFRRAADNRLETVALAVLLVIGSLNNSGWRDSSAARALTALLYYGVIAGAVAMSMFLNQDRLRAAARAVHVRLKSRTSSAASSLPSVAEAEGEGCDVASSASAPRFRCGNLFACSAGSLERAAELASRFLCWHLPRIDGRRGAGHREQASPAAAQEVEMNEVSADVPAPDTITDASGKEWTKHLNEDGVPYYSCEATGKTQWEHPE